MAYHPTANPLERQLNLILALDKARDAIATETNPAAMFQAIAAHLCTEFRSEACAIMVMGTTGQTMEYIATEGINSLIAVDLCTQASTHHHPSALETDKWAYTLGLQIAHDDDQADAGILGGMFIARQTDPFDDIDHQLFVVAESQIDSAVFQARRIIQLAQHNRQLEAIAQIDRLRDSETDETALIHAFSSLLDAYFKPDLIMILLRHDDSGEMVLRGLVDRGDLTSEARRAIRALAAGVTAPRAILSPPEIADLGLLCAPLIVNNERLGEVIIGRLERFRPADTRLIAAMTAQMDSAIAHSRVVNQLKQRTQELETVYKIDRIRDTESDLDTMLQHVLTTLCEVIQAQLGYLMLFSEDAERKLELRATTDGGEIDNAAYFDVIHQVSREALHQANPVYHNGRSGPVRSIVAIPLKLNQEIIGVFGAVNGQREAGFSQADQRILTAITSQVDTAVFERLERRRMRRVLSRSVDPSIIDLLLDRANQGILSGERVTISVVFCDLRNSTEWTERTAAEPLVSTLNQYLAAMTDVIFKYGGTLDKFVGDEVIALFGVPVATSDHANRAIACAQAMRRAHRTLRHQLTAENIELPTLGIGVSTGEAIAGEMGSPNRTDFTAIGHVMNLGARLCAAAQGGQILLCDTTAEDQDATRELQPLTLKGLGEVRVFELLDDETTA
jgi:adenylate cyclase